MRSQTPLSSMELSCVSCSRSFSPLPSSSSFSSSSSVTSTGFLIREVKGKASITCSRVRASAEGSTERTIDDARGGSNSRRSSFAAGIEVSAPTSSTTTAIDRSFGGDAAAELAVWEKLGAVVRLSYGLGIYGAMALGGNFICSITGIDNTGGFHPSLKTIVDGLGYAAPPIMALLFILDEYRL